MPGVPLASAHGVRAWLAKARARIRWPEWVALISATILLVSMFFLTWFTVTRTSGGAGTKYFINDTVDGWHGATHLRWLLLLTIVMTLMLFTFQATRRAPVLPATFSLFVMLLAGASTIWLIFRVLIDPPAGRNLGGWVAL